jgi:surface carbohydrate biosynthesis protein
MLLGLINTSSILGNIIVKIRWIHNLYNVKKMFAQIKRTWKIFRHFIFSKRVWSWPKQSDVLIFDTNNQELLLRFLEPWKPEILHVRGEQINMRVLIASILNSGSKIDAYVDCFIRKVCPRLLVTFIDNNVNFLTISQRHPDVKTLFIQNGWRSYSGDLFEALDQMDSNSLDKLAVDYSLTFGPLIGREFARYISGTVVSIGSIRNNHASKLPVLQKGVVAFISTWQKMRFHTRSNDYTEDTYFAADGLIIQSLLCYAKEKNKRLMIIPRNHKHSELRNQEEKYFREILDQEPEFFDQLGPYPSYQAIDFADVVVGVDSTLVYESIARGNKTAAFTIRGNVLSELRGFNYGWPGNFPDEGPFWTNNPDPDSFFRILDYLFEVDDVQWCKDVEATNFSSLMIYDQGNEVLKSTLDKLLKPPLETKNILPLV